MTESVTPPDPPLVDPETGETPPLSPPRYSNLLADAFPSPETFRKAIARLEGMMHMPPAPPRKAWLYGEWDEYEGELAAHLESDDAA
jgi:hypothetical protein